MHQLSEVGPLFPGIDCCTCPTPLPKTTVNPLNASLRQHPHHSDLFFFDLVFPFACLPDLLPLSPAQHKSLGLLLKNAFALRAVLFLSYAPASTCIVLHTFHLSHSGICAAEPIPWICLPLFLLLFPGLLATYLFPCFLFVFYRASWCEDRACASLSPPQCLHRDPVFMIFLFFIFRASLSGHIGPSRLLWGFTS